MTREMFALGGQAIADMISVTSKQRADGSAKAARDYFGAVDIVVNNPELCMNAAFDERSTGMPV